MFKDILAGKEACYSWRKLKLEQNSADLMESLSIRDLGVRASSCGWLLALREVS